MNNSTSKRHGLAFVTVALVAVVHTPQALAQGKSWSEGPVTSQQALPVLVTAAAYLLVEADSLPDLNRPSPKRLLAGRRGTVAINVLTNDRPARGVDPHIASRLAVDLADALAQYRLTAIAVASNLVNELCPQVFIRPGRSPRQCSFKAGTAMILSMSYPLLQRDGTVLVPVSVYTDLPREDGSLVVSAEIVIERRAQDWQVKGVKKLVGR